MKRVAAIAALIAIGAFAVGAAAAPGAQTGRAVQPAVQQVQAGPQTAQAATGYAYCYGPRGRGMHRGMYGRMGRGRRMGYMMGGMMGRRMGRGHGGGHPWYYYCMPWHW